MRHPLSVKKLVLSKKTVSNLSTPELSDAHGGAIYPTDPVRCWTRYKDQCMSNDPRYCPPSDYPGCIV